MTSPYFRRHERLEPAPGRPLRPVNFSQAVKPSSPPSLKPSSPRTRMSPRNILVLGARRDRQRLWRRLSKFHDVTLIGGASHAEGNPARWPGHAGPVPGNAAASGVLVGASIEPARCLLPPGTQRRRRAADRRDAAGRRDDCLRQNGLYSENLVKDLVAIARSCAGESPRSAASWSWPGGRQHGLPATPCSESQPAIAGENRGATDRGRPRRPLIPDIKKDMWRKAVFNCVINPTTALLGSEVGAIVDPQLNSLKRQLHRRLPGRCPGRWLTFDEDFVALIDRVFGRRPDHRVESQDLMKAADGDRSLNGRWSRTRARTTASPAG